MLVALSAALLTACTSAARAPQPVPTTQTEAPDLNAKKAEEDAATTLYLACIAKEAKRLDDRTSAPASIAPGILSACGVQLDAAVKIYSRNFLQSGGDYSQTSREVEAALRRSASDFAIRAILENRAKTRKQPVQLNTAPRLVNLNRSEGQPTGKPYEDALDAYFRGDYGTAIRLIKPLAENGEAPAQAMLGGLYAAVQNYAEAAKWNRRAADQGYPDAQHMLGNMYIAGLGVRRATLKPTRGSASLLLMLLLLHISTKKRMTVRLATVLWSPQR